MKKAIILFLICFYSCQPNSYNKRITEISAPKATDIVFFCHYIECKDIIEQKYYSIIYPLQVNIIIINEHNNIIPIDSLESITDYYAIGKCFFNNEIINCYITKKDFHAMKRENSFSFSAAFKDLAIFDSIYSKTQFNNFLVDFKKEAKVYLYCNNDQFDSIYVDTEKMNFNFIDTIGEDIDSTLIGHEDGIVIDNFPIVPQLH